MTMYRIETIKKMDVTMPVKVCEIAQSEEKFMIFIPVHELLRKSAYSELEFATSMHRYIKIEGEGRGSR